MVDHPLGADRHRGSDRKCDRLLRLAIRWFAGTYALGIYIGLALVLLVVYPAIFVAQFFGVPLGFTDYLLSSCLRSLSLWLPYSS